MRLRSSSRELVYTAEEFATLNHAEICRHLSIGDSWLDEQQDEHAEQQLRDDLE